jgi:hypothetical protein
MDFDKLLTLYATADALLDPFPYGGGVRCLLCDWVLDFVIVILLLGDID